MRERERDELHKIQVRWHAATTYEEKKSSMKTRRVVLPEGAYCVQGVAASDGVVCLSDV